jgi:hypothetical protein
VIRPARNPIPINTTASAARMAQMGRLLRKGESSREYGCAASTTRGGETATGGTGTEGGTGMAALFGTGLAAGGGAGSDGLAATASTGSGSATSSASTGSSSATSADADAGGTWRTAGRGGGFDVRGAGEGPAVDSVGRGGGRGGGLVDGFVASTFAGGWEGPRLGSRGTRACTAVLVGISPRPSLKASATSILRLTVESASLVLSRPIAANAGTLRAWGGVRRHGGKGVGRVDGPVTALLVTDINAR